MIFFLIPVEFIFAIFLLGAGTIENTTTWMQTIEAHYLLIMFFVISISFAIVFSLLLHGKMSTLHKVLLIMIFLLISSTVIGNYSIWSTKEEQKRQVQSLTSLLHITEQIEGNSSTDNNNNNSDNNEVMTDLFNSMKVSLGYLCVCMATVPIIGYIAYQINKNKVLAFFARFTSTILMCGFILCGILMFKEMLINWSTYI